MYEIDKDTLKCGMFNMQLQMIQLSITRLFLLDYKTGYGKMPTCIAI